MLAFFLPVMQTHGCCYVDQPANISVFLCKTAVPVWQNRNFVCIERYYLCPRIY